ncbi:uncharacterized protein CIMG_00038 [Coccidioides immitis RS]|uniref:Trafficking PGA2 n=4 Tax=Coccidioides immitis TaxID=5501 RepID=J3KG51_COCIM|nr:uncharacterized protein CIMG_00038 [Coccidioides immitis RS]KMO99867.1 hypothetical protein CIRG_00010 [Coccidioides immitis RMSCC 2394]KMU73310.1 hypothetical protein CISG_10057 [Coccidioides immitis RMSCC 3703]KMU91807.1 hypothetical protein CIHG_09613 [Coccidioides immitis H538.4]TPX26953.1 hypothetical protein DIZ76_012417 [Coccidioides immitis]EAS34684.3 hypothetical protein CIMG_00038 [Coccidioides immitis RS]
MSDFPLLAVLHTWYTNFTTNVSNSVSNLTVRDYIRLVWIIGGYMFLRPYLDKGFRRLFEKGVAKSEKAEEAQAEAQAQQAGGAMLTANDLRDGRGNESEDDDDDGGASSAVPQWGKSARRKQRKFLEFLEQEAERRREDDDDRDIADLLED